MVPLRVSANSDGYNTDAEIEYQSMRNLRTNGTMFVLEMPTQRRAELGWVAGDAVRDCRLTGQCGS